MDGIRRERLWRLRHNTGTAALSAQLRHARAVLPRNEQMIQFSIQVHPDRSPQLDLSSLLSECERLATDKALVSQFSWAEGFDEHTYVNITFETDRPRQLWELLHEQVYQGSTLGSFMQIASIAVCEGQHGWDDYLLLHHYDAGLKRDEVPDEW